MSNGQGAVAGAAQGAVAGSVILPGIGTAVGAVLGGIGGWISGSSADAQQANAMAWAGYNNSMKYNTDIYNIKNSLAIAGINAILARKSGEANARNVLAAAKYNANIIEITTEYNTELLNDQITQVWQDLDLDITQIEMFRARERGSMIANQAASGTVINQDGNAVLVMDQMTQESLDTAIVQFGADRQAAGISNQIAQGRWQGEVAIQQTMWEGNMAAYNYRYNANLQATGSMASAIIQADANMYSAKQAFMAGGNNIAQSNYQFSQQQTQNMINGLFSAGSTYVGYRYAGKVPGAGQAKPGTGAPAAQAVTLATGGNLTVGLNA